MFYFQFLWVVAVTGLSALIAFEGQTFYVGVVVSFYVTAFGGLCYFVQLLIYLASFMFVLYSEFYVKYLYSNVRLLKSSRKILLIF